MNKAEEQQKHRDAIEDFEKEDIYVFEEDE